VLKMPFVSFLPNSIELLKLKIASEYIAAFKAGVLYLAEHFGLGS
jgi:hypothetical protein